MEIRRLPGTNQDMGVYPRKGHAINRSLPYREVTPQQAEASRQGMV
ncbi:MAG: hypothetical protein ABSC11_05455 [Smithella sp.]